MSIRCLVNKSIFNKNLISISSTFPQRIYSQDSQSTTNESAPGQPPKSGYAKAFEKFESLGKSDEKPLTFKELLMKSKLIDLGDPEGKIVTGRIFHIVEDDLYIDFGWKFHCVCSRPKTNASSYVRGTKVRLLIKDLELSSKFLGYEKDLTLLEAECVLLGLAQERSAKAT